MINLILCHFGEGRSNAGNNNLYKYKTVLDPAVSTFKQAFPDSKVILYTDIFDDEFDEVEVIKITEHPGKIAEDHPRKGWRLADYYRAYGLLKTKGFSVYLDSDMYIKNPGLFRTALPLTQRFGICVPANSRDLVAIDGNIGADSNYKIGEDPTMGTGYISNASPIMYWSESERGTEFLETYCRLFEESPVRGPINLWRATWESGINPYMLPLQWCVCRDDLKVEHPICLHVGHKEVESLI
jgi:hypothetical protein